jgi:pyruvate formate lyase activating enzyme
MHEAMFWEKAADEKVKCSLCRFRCLIAEGHRGVCGVRENREGTLYSLVYGRSIAESVDPIEKKPLFHYQPGSRTFSVATVGCNFRCLHCQNYQIAHHPMSNRPIAGENLPPAEIVRRAKEAGCRSISYTYTEPTIFYEYAYDTALLARREGLGNIFVTNGYITEEALTHLAPYLDAANVDLKGFSEKFYRDVAGATLQGVLDSLKVYHRLGIWTEVTTLVIPGHNDDEADMKGVARFIATEMGPEVPWHISAFYPSYRMLDRPPTPVKTLLRARDIGLEAGLRYVYLGNVPGEGGESTICPACRRAVVERSGYRLGSVHIEEGRCAFCGELQQGKW